MPGWEIAAGAGSELLGSLVNNIWAQANQAGQREHTYQMTDYLYDKDLEQWNRQNEFNIQMWNMQNEYNSPASQMQRYKQAGLNPNLIYEQGSPGLSSPVPQATGPSAKGSPSQPFRPQLEIPHFIDMLYMIKDKTADIANKEAMKTSIEADVNLKYLDAALKGLELGYKPEQLKYLVDEMNFNRSQWDVRSQINTADLEKLRAEKGKIEKETGKIGYESSLLKKELDFADTNYNYQREFFKNEVAKMPYDLQAKQLEISEISSHIAEMASKAGLNAKEAELLGLKISALVNLNVNVDKDPYYFRQVRELDEGRHWRINPNWKHP